MFGLQSRSFLMLSLYPLLFFLLTTFELQAVLLLTLFSLQPFFLFALTVFYIKALLLLAGAAVQSGRFPKPALLPLSAAPHRP